MIGTLVLKNSRLKAENQRLQVEKEQLLRDREAEEAKAEDEVDEREASAATSTEQKKIEGLTKAKEKAVARWQCYKGQVKGAVKTISNLKNQVDYLETLLRFEERSRYSSMLSELQLE